MKRRKLTREKEDSGRHNHNKHENEDKKDTLSDFPDCILLHILSFLNTKNSVQTCLLSTRWKNLWKQLSTLTFHDIQFKTSEAFTEFVNQIISLRDSSEPVNAIDFIGWSWSDVKPELLETVVTYAVSHNINSLTLHYCLRHFPSSLISCPSLTSLKIWPICDIKNLVHFPNSLNLPALTYLKLRCFSFSIAKDGRIEPFSIFKRLNTLILGDILIPDAKTLCIESTTLVNLSIELEFAFIHGSYSMELSAPNLCSFSIIGDYCFKKLIGSSLNFIKEVNIDVRLNPFLIHNPLILLDWLTKFVNITSLTVSTATLQVLSLVPDLLKGKSPPWYNLKSLKVLVLQEQHVLFLCKDMKAHYEPYLHILEGIVDFLLRNSPSAEFEMVKSEPM